MEIAAFEEAIHKALISIGIGRKPTFFHGVKADGERFCFVVEGRLFHTVRLYLASEVESFVAKKDLEPVRFFLYSRCLRYIAYNGKALENVACFGYNDMFEDEVQKCLRTLNFIDIKEEFSGKTKAQTGFHFCFCQTELKCYYTMLFATQEHNGEDIFFEFSFYDDLSKSRLHQIKDYLETTENTNLIDEIAYKLESYISYRKAIEWSAVEILKNNYSNLDDVIIQGQMVGLKANPNHSSKVAVYAGQNKVMILKEGEVTKIDATLLRTQDIFAGFADLNDPDVTLYLYEGNRY
uniref:BTB domain-containing protein n=1 Tax=Rhabditophanes sp. KR3021 TaxID=114890 RepID=A0AC35TWS6_9BILA